MFNIYGPLEQFEIIPIFPLYFGFIDFSVVNSLLIFLVSLFLFFFGVKTVLSPTNSPRIFKGYWQFFLESLVQTTASILADNVGKDGEKFYPFVFVNFLFIILANVIGLIPYSFTITSHLILTFSIALFIFIGINLVGFQKHGSNMLALFLPGGSDFFLALLLVPIEIVSYVFKPISLSVRLFANMMAGHTLTHVIAGFSASLLSLGGFFFVLHVFPLFVLVALMGLEFGVSLIQAYVFSTLACIYLHDVLNLH